MIIGKAAGVFVITIARKGLWGQFIPLRFLEKLRLLIKMLYNLILTLFE
jgi:hypothetical protein